jgi:hypothetical protein
LADVVITYSDGNVKRYPMPDEFTYGEMRTLKAITGLMPVQFEAAISGGDAETIMALAVIAGRRVGDEVEMEALDGLPYGAVTIEGDEDDPPTEEAAAADDAEQNPTTPGNGGNPS